MCFPQLFFFFCCSPIVVEAPPPDPQGGSGVSASDGPALPAASGSPQQAHATISGSSPAAPSVEAGLKGRSHPDASNATKGIDGRPLQSAPAANQAFTSFACLFHQSAADHLHFDVFEQSASYERS